ncbi:hypothetical protein SAMN05216338_1001846 [Bradyrhizobium sp. Rc2d]|uniref:hypothetical protein n=1 Tax=Bradyrhizobium sp. Rc2d TaxID=1855321 RepID=UPI000886D432|nr:hypothetical protein [Bradyrhizobium sp. Rc2d]SDG59461.1 hypothetical protein SAMN05216338_1001846 [Bradyrhizobium sp. Rc2d]
MRDWIVMTASASMPSNCRGIYRNVAVIEIEKAGIVPKMISERARGVRRIVRHYGPQSVGKTDRCAYACAVASAEAMCTKLRDEHAAKLARLHDALSGGAQLTAPDMAMLD